MYLIKGDTMVGSLYRVFLAKLAGVHQSTLFGVCQRLDSAPWDCKSPPTKKMALATAEAGAPAYAI